MRLSSTCPLLAILFALLLSSAWGEEEISLKSEEVPAAVMAVMVKAANGSPLVEFVRAMEDGKVVYSAEFTNAESKLMEVTVSKDAVLIAIELETEDPVKTDPANPGAPATPVVPVK